MEGHLGLRGPLKGEEGQGIALVNRSEDLNEIEKAPKSSGIGASEWRLEADSNCRPRDYETLALTT